MSMGEMLPTVNMVSLLHFNGVSNATIFADEIGKTWTAVGTAKLDTASKKFGSASLLLDGNSDYATTPDSADFYYGTGEFTTGGWFKWNTVAACGLWGQDADNNNTAQAYLYAGNTLIYYVVDGASVKLDIEYGFTPVAGTWYWIVLRRSGNDFSWFINGDKKSTTTDTDGVPNLASVFYLGLHLYNSAADTYFNGNIDEFFNYKGYALTDRQIKDYYAWSKGARSGLL